MLQTYVYTGPCKDTKWIVWWIETSVLLARYVHQNLPQTYVYTDPCIYTQCFAVDISFICPCMYVCVYVNCVCMYACMYVCMYVCMCVCVCVNCACIMYICMYVCMLPRNVQHTVTLNTNTYTGIYNCLGRSGSNRQRARYRRRYVCVCVCVCVYVFLCMCVCVCVCVLEEEPEDVKSHIYTTRWRWENISYQTSKVNRMPSSGGSNLICTTRWRRTYLLYDEKGKYIICFRLLSYCIYGHIRMGIFTTRWRWAHIL